MSTAVLTTRSDAPSAVRSRVSLPASAGLRVGAPGDTFEQQADRVADTVAAGGRIQGLSLSGMSIGHVQRVAAPEHRKGTGESLEAAFLRTSLGRRIAREHGRQGRGPHEGPEAARTGMVEGPEATYVVESLATALGSLPARIPEIALDSVSPGLRVRVSYHGSPERPTQGRVSIVGGVPETTRASAPAATRSQAAPAKTKMQATDPHGTHQLQAHQAHSAHAHAATPSAEGKAAREETVVQRKVDPAAPLVADRAAVDSVVNRPGRPLDASTRSFMESRIGYDFSRVRVHTDGSAAASARALGAQAYTSGTTVVFGAGRFAPESSEGRRLLAHELTHVVQQDGARSHPVIRRAPLQVQRAPEDEGAPDAGSGSWFTNPVEKLKGLVRKIPGFKLFTVILGWDPVSETKVDRTAQNVVQGVMGLVPGGDAAFKNLQESGALERAFTWLKGEIDQLGFTVAYFKGLAKNALDSLGLGDVTDPAGALAKVAGFFKPPFEKLKRFALDALDKVLEFVVEGVLSALGGLGVMEVLKKVGAAFKQIVKDPVGFLKNLLKAVGQGLTQFKDRIVEHLKNGLVQWIFGQVAATGLTLPKRFDFGGIVGLILQVLGLTYARFRTRLVNIIGETPVKAMEGTFDILVAMKNEGLGAAWKMILEKASGLIDTVMGAVRQWAVTNIVITAVTKLATLFNPVGAVVQAIQVIYKTVTFFMEKIKQVTALVNSVLDSVGEIASGNVAKAANYVEQSMAKTVPLVLGFLADLLGLGGIGKEIKKIIDAIQGTVDKAIAKILDFIVGKAKELIGKGKEAVVQAIGWWKERRAVKVGGEDHAIYMDGTEDAPEVMVASTPRQWSDFFKKSKAPADGEQAKIFARCQEIVKELKKPIKAAKATDKMDKEESKSANVDVRRKLFNELAANIQLLKMDEAPDVPVSVIKYSQERESDGGGKKATAPILSKNHGQGSVPNDDPPIWKDLGSLISSKNYVQGHLINHNLGGEGRRFNLSPINKKANSRHLHDVEEHVKLWVNQKGRVVSYSVQAIYGKQPRPAAMEQLTNEAKKDGLSEARKKTIKVRLDEYKAEQRLPVAFRCEARGLVYDSKSKTWKADNKAFNDKIGPDEHKSPIIEDVPTLIET